MGISIEKALGFFETRVNIGTFFGMNAEDVYITLNEPNEDEQLDMNNDKDQNITKLKRLWKKCLSAEKHNFEVEKDGVVEKATKEQVINVLSNKGICLAYIIGEWYKTIPLAPRNDSK